MLQKTSSAARFCFHDGSGGAMAESDMFFPFPNAIFRLARLLFAARHAKIQTVILKLRCRKAVFQKNAVS